MLKRLSATFAPSADNTNDRGRAKNSMAFAAMNKDFLTQLDPLPQDQRVVMIDIKAANNLPYTDSVSCTTDPFCRVNVMEPVQELDQLQRTSQICHTVNPVWSDDSMFYFIVEDDSKLLFNVMRNFGMNAKVANFIGKRKFLGDAILKVSTLTTDMTEHVLPLIDPETGGTEANLVVEGRFMSKEEAMNTRYDVCFQYQRYNMSWSDQNLLPTDPGRFSNKDNTLYGAQFDDVAEEIPEGWVVVEPWITTANEVNGWLYAVDYTSNSWYTEKASTVFVRRRTWTRCVARKDIAEALLAAKQEEGTEEGEGEVEEVTDQLGDVTVTAKENDTSKKVDETVSVVQNVI